MTIKKTFVPKRRLSNELLQAILAASSDGIAIVGVDGDFLEANAIFGRMFGVNPEQVVGMKCVEVLGCEKMDGHAGCREGCMVQQVLRQEQLLSPTEINFMPEGTLSTVGLTMTPVKTKNNRLCLMIARDVTALGNVARMKTNFVAMITHELRAPLNAINGYLDLALTGAAGELNEELRDFLRRARAGSEHLYALLEDSLLVARADAGQWRLKREIVSLADVVTNAVEELEFTATDNAITLTVDIADAFPPIYADEIRMQQVVRNLLSNALRFTPDGGQVRVSVGIEPNRNEDISNKHRDVVVLQVSDTGYGIPLDQQQLIFERFYLGSNMAAGRARGQGLGLAAVKMIVEQHGGKVLVKSVPGEGSVFTCVLPCLLA
ncbi:MAG TPA: PAS domain-containing sensor histidine kinase [Ktedonobacteraceae bacterium]|nr:PAS domain-containing sensor histidine kinase [Ktedonobacteraceae bacterium]